MSDKESKRFEKIGENEYLVFRFDEFFDWSVLKADVEEILLDCGQLVSINSCGVRSLTQATVGGKARIIYKNCTSELIEHFGLVAPLVKNAIIESFYKEYECDDCDHQQRIFHRVTGPIAETYDMEEDEGLKCEACGSDNYGLVIDPGNFAEFIENLKKVA